MKPTPLTPEVDIIPPHNLDEGEKEYDTEIYIAIQDKNIENIRYYLNKGADPRSTYAPKSRLNHTTFQAAVERRAVDIVGLMLDHGADPNYCGLGTLPIHLAIANLNLKMVRLLLSKGADPMGLDSLGRSAVVHATDLEAWDILEILKGSEG